MTYLTFNDGKSDKFWQIELLDTNLNIAWGKTGTSGKHQVKTFECEKAANIAMDKLIKEKLKKGYKNSLDTGSEEMHVSVDEAITPMIDPTSHSARNKTLPQSSKNKALEAFPADIHAYEVVLPAQLTKKAFSNRSRPWQNATLNLNQSWQKIYQFVNTSYVNFQSLLPSIENSSETFINAIIETENRIKSNNQEGSLLSDAILLHTYQQCFIRRDLTDTSYCMTEFIIAKHGLINAIEILLLSFQIDLSDENNHGLKYQQTLSGPNSTSSEYNTFLYYFREYLSCTDDETWLTCASKLIQSLDYLHISRHAFIAFLIPEKPDIIRNIPINLIDAKNNKELDWHTYEWAMNLLIFTIPIEAFLNQEVQAELNDIIIRPKHFPDLIFDKFVVELVIDRGVILEESIIKTFGWASTTSKTALSLMPTSSAIKSLSHHIETKVGLSFFQKSIHNWPLLAIPVLAELLINEPEHYIFKYLLQKLIIEQHNKLDSLLPTIDSQYQAIIIELKNRLVSDLSDDEYTTELPKPLISPSWLNNQSDIKAVVPINALPILHSTPENHFTPAEIKKANNFSLGLFKNDQITDDTIHYLIQWLGFSISRENELYPDIVKALKSFDKASLLNAYDAYLQTQKLSINFTLTRLLPDEIAVEIWNRYSIFGYEGTDYMLTRHGFQAIPGLIRLLDSSPAKNIVFASKLVSAENAIPIAKAFNTKKPIRQKAAKWLLDFKTHAIIGLIPQALCAKGKLLDNAITALTYIASEGSRDLILQIADKYNNSNVSQSIALLINQSQTRIVNNNTPNLPTFWHPNLYSRPKLKTNLKSLPNFAMNHLTMMLSQSSIEMTFDDLSTVIDEMTPDSFSKFIWELFLAWNYLSGDLTESWMVSALTLAPTDKNIDGLTDYILTWPGQSLTQRSLLGLEILAKIGSDKAIISLNSISNQAKQKSLKLAAKHKIEEIAKNRNLTLESLEDKLVQTFGFDANGEKILDFDGLQYKLKLGQTLNLNIYDMDGNQLNQLPKIKSNFDSQPIKMANDFIKALPKEIKKIIATQTKRLEQAMCKRRRWSVEEFNALFIENPILNNLGQKLIFGVYDGSTQSSLSAEILQLFRINEDKSFSDESDTHISLKQFKNMRIGIIHPIGLSSNQLIKLSTLLDDYNIIQPFNQIHRPYFTFNGSNHFLTSLERYHSLNIPTKQLISLLNEGFIKHNEGSEFKMLGKEIHDDLSVRIVFEPGFVIVMPDDEPIQTIVMVEIVDPITLKPKSRVQIFDKIDPIATSELLLTLNTLSSC